MKNSEEFETCECCGYRSRLKELFLLARSMKEKKRRVCPNCYVKISGVFFKEVMLLLFLFLLFYTALTYLSPSINPPWVIINIILFVIVYSFSALPHELGHALCAKALGGFVHKVVVGNGPLLIRFNLGNTDCELRRYWSHGVVYLSFDHHVRFFALRYTCSILAGPLVNLLLAFVAWLLMKSDYFEPNLNSSVNLLWLFINANLLLFIGNIIPSSTQWLGNAETDGAHVFKYFFNKKEFLRNFQVQHYLLRLHQLAEEEEYQLGLILCDKVLSELPNNRWVMYFYCYFLINLGEYARAIELIENEIESELLDRSNVESKILLAHAHKNLAHALSTSKNDSERMLESASYSFQSMPWEPSIIQVYGVARCMSGDFEVGVKELKRALTIEQSNRSLCDNYAQLGLVYCAENKLEVASDYLRQAQLINKHCRLVSQLEVDLVNAQPSSYTCELSQ